MEEMHYAAARGDLEAILSELKKGVDINKQSAVELPRFEIPDQLHNDEESEFSEDIGFINQSIDFLKESVDFLKEFEDIFEESNSGYEETPLILAAGNRQADVEILELLLNHGADINAKGGSVETCALGAAIRNGPTEKVKALLEYGADVYYVCSTGFGAWLDLAYNYTDSQEEIADLLLSKNINFEQSSEYSREQPIRMLSHRGKFQLLKKLVDAGADPKPLRWSDLMWSIVYESIDDVNDHLKQDCCDLSHRDWNRRTPWLLAVEVGDVHKAKALLSHGANIHDCSSCEGNALFHALKNDCDHMLKWLISLGLDIEKRDMSNSTPLMIAAEKNAVKCLKVLLDAEADRKAFGDIYDNALCAASKIEAIKILVNEGFDINFVAGDGYTLLKSAVESNDFQLVKDLLLLGADTETSRTGDTALHKAIYMDYLDIAEFLLKVGANPNAEDVDGETPLHYCQSKKAIDLLISFNANKSVMNIVGDTPKDSLREDLRLYLRKIK